MTMAVESGKVESDHWLVFWDHSEDAGQLTWNVRDLVDGTKYVCRQDNGWRIGRKGAQQDVSLARLAETTLVEEEGWRELLSLLEEVVDW